MKRRIENGVTIISTGDAVGGVKNKYGTNGVSTHKSDNAVKYRSEIQHNNKKYYLGLRNTVEEASELRKEAERRIKDGSFLEWHDSLGNYENKHGIKGLSYNKKNGKYQMSLVYLKKKYFISYFNSIEDAAIIRELIDRHIKDGTFIEWLEWYKSNK